ncbi:DUF3192 domain-containing protein [Alteromonadaceae bacterium BrNp21-10]|nr:DUF3192 domain-containing protein [Alteromonadaceae bacterium BrNp21-10]
MKKTLIAAVLITPIVLSGCVVSVDGRDDNHWKKGWKDTEFQNRQKISELSVNLSIEDIRSAMGVAEFNELYQRDGANIQVLYYRTQRTEDDGITTKDECTPLVFKNGILIGWGNTVFSSI